MDSNRIEGYCPMGCGETLFRGAGGGITCSYLQCPDPTAVDTILSERETEHVVVIDADGFTIKHPLRERVHGELFECGLHAYMAALGGPPQRHGRYRAMVDDDGFRFVELPS